jgi:hypothetical protein
MLGGMDGEVEVVVLSVVTTETFATIFRIPLSATGSGSPARRVFSSFPSSSRGSPNLPILRALRTSPSSDKAAHDVFTVAVPSHQKNVWFLPSSTANRFPMAIDL